MLIILMSCFEEVNRRTSDGISLAITGGTMDRSHDGKPQGRRTTEACLRSLNHRKEDDRL